MADALERARRSRGDYRVGAGRAARAAGRACSCRRSPTAAARSSCSKGREGAGKKHALKQLAAASTRAIVAVHCDAPRPARGGRRPLARALLERSCRRRATPRSSSAAGIAACSTTAFSAGLDDKALARAFDEINEFEAQQRDYGTLHRQAVLRRQRRRPGAHGSRNAPANPWRAGHPRRRSGQRPTSPAMPRRFANSAPIPIRAGRRGG